MSTPIFSVTLRGLEETLGHMVALQDFKKLAKPAVQAALDKVTEAQRPRIKRASGKAQGSVGTHIHMAKWGVYGNAGPRGTSRFREGYLAAIFLDSGTGLRGPLHKRIEASERHVKRFKASKSQYRKETLGLILSGRESASRLIKGGKPRLNLYSPGISTGGVFTFPAYGSTSGGGSAFGGLFGARARSTTSRGKYRQGRFGALGKVFARSDVGIAPQPWAKAARQAANRPAQSAFSEALWRNIAAASRA
jgi:hypothetical protein